MHNIIKKALSDEHVLIAKCIFKGMTNAQIADKINCSQSSVSYKLNALFSKYNAKNKIEFIIHIFAQIMSSNKERIKIQEETIKYYEKEIENIKKIIIGLLKNRRHPENYQYWCLEAKKHFN